MYLIVDVSWLYCKYYFVNRDKGYPDSGIYGFSYFLSLLYNNIRDFTGVYFVLDGENSLEDKKKIYSEYKKGRSTKGDVYKNFNDFLKILYSYGITITNSGIKSQIIKNRFREADETIAYIALNHSDKAKVLIYSGDKDFIQLTALSDNISISEKYSEGKFIELTDKEIFQKFKNSKKEDFTRISSNKKDIIKYRVLSGDPSDNIPVPIKGLQDKVKKLIIEAWKEDHLDQDVYANIILQMESMDLRLKLAAACDAMLLNYKLMDLSECKLNYKLRTQTKKLSMPTTPEEFNKLIEKYKLYKYQNMLYGLV